MYPKTRICKNFFLGAMHERCGGRGEGATRGYLRHVLVHCFQLENFSANIIHTMPRVARMRGLLMMWGMLHAIKSHMHTCLVHYCTGLIEQRPKKSVVCLSQTERLYSGVSNFVRFCSYVVIYCLRFLFVCSCFFRCFS